MGKYKILLADDHSLIRQGVAFIIEDLGWETEVFQASTLHQTVELLKEKTIDLTVMDIQFPDGNSLSILPEIKDINPNIKILIFSGLEEKTQALKFIQAGANGFLSKLSSEEEISLALVNMKNEGKYLSSLTQELLLISMLNPVANPLSQLTERELQVANLYANGLGNLEIANQLDIKQNTVSTMKKRIFEKLQVENLIELVNLLKENS
jgi:DNA-binding NarL/FixJ family response regulator